MTAFLAKSTAAMIHLSIARLIHSCAEITNGRVIQNAGITNGKMTNDVAIDKQRITPETHPEVAVPLHSHPDRGMKVQWIRHVAWHCLPSNRVQFESYIMKRSTSL
jgi:hypothetical protein